MDFEYQTPGWKAEGTEPTELKENGWQANQKPPASIFNWFWKRVSDCISELQTKMSVLQDNIAEQLNGKTNVGHQHAMLDVADLVGTINSVEYDISQKANLSHTHTISNISGLQNTLNGKAPYEHTHADLESAIAGKQDALGFVPVQQSGGDGQKDNKIYIGWSGSSLKAQVDATDMGNIVTTGAANNAILPISKGGTGASSADGALDAMMTTAKISISDFCSLTGSNSGSDVSGNVFRVGNDIHAQIRVTDPQSSGNGSQQIITIASAYRPSSVFSGVSIGMVAGNVYIDGRYYPITGYINAGNSRNGIVTCIFPSVSTTYDRMDIYLNYSIR